MLTLTRRLTQIENLVAADDPHRRGLHWGNEQCLGGRRLFIEPRLDIGPIEVETAVDAFAGGKSAFPPMAPAPQGHRTDVEEFAPVTQARSC